MSIKRISLLLWLLLALASCSTKKNTVVSRAYHNLTARFNGYYYSNEAISDGVYKVEREHKDNFEKILPVYIYPDPDKVKTTFPEFDKAIKKSSLCIQKHAIKNKAGSEIPTAGKWIDNNWINIGIAHFYKREFFSAIEAFEYVIRTYTKSDDKFTAMIWLIKANNEIGSVSSSEPIISLLKNDKHLPSKVKSEFPVVQADYYLRRGQVTEAMAKLMETTRKTNFFTGVSRKKRARYSFIVGQLSEKNKDNNRAISFYKKTIKLKPNYEMVFYSKIKVARLQDLKRNNSEKIKKDLLKMAKEFKNSDYYDVIYYTLGEIEEREKHIPPAIAYYKKSVQTSVANVNQKALSYLKLGEIHFDMTSYELAGAYYDSAVVTLPQEHPDYKQIVARKKTLEALIGHIKTITREDSLQRIAKMSEEDRIKFIDKLITRMKEEAERKEREAEAAKNANNGNQSGGLAGPQSSIPGFGGEATSFYFYNPNTVALGISEFTRKWGNRKLEDNWRRSNKTLVLSEDDAVKADSVVTGKMSGKSIEKNRESFLKALPLNDSLLTVSHNRIIKAFYMMGSIYKEELHNSVKTIAAFEELNKRYPSNKYLLNTYYQLYRIYLEEKNQPEADYYRNKILGEFPDSEFALLIKNPEYAQELNAQKSEVENYYATTLETYKSKNYSESYRKAAEGIKTYGKNEYTPKFEFIKAMSLGYTNGVDTLQYFLKLLVAKYPNSDMVPLSNDILLSIKKQKNPELFKEAEPGKANVDTFSVNFDAEHYLILVTPDNPKLVDDLKTNLGTFNTTYYSEQKFDIAGNLFGSDKQLVLIKSFANAKDAVIYYETLMADRDVFKGSVKKEEMEVLPIMKDNLPLFYKKKNVQGYKLFYQDNYKNLNTKN